MAQTFRRRRIEIVVQRLARQAAALRQTLDRQETAQAELYVKGQFSAVDAIRQELAWEFGLVSHRDVPEREGLLAVQSNPAFAFLGDPAEDLYTASDGRPFHAPR